MNKSPEFEYQIRAVSLTDVPAIANIYNWYVANTTVTFEVEPVSENTMVQRVKESGDSNPWIVLESAGQILGYAYVSPWKSRAAYAQAKETSVYIHHDFNGRGFGLALMAKLIDKARSEPIHVLIAGITLPNEASVALHEKLGFSHIGRFSEVGFKFDQYIDVGYWQLLIGNT